MYVIHVYTPLIYSMRLTESNVNPLNFHRYSTCMYMYSKKVKYLHVLYSKKEAYSVEIYVGKHGYSTEDYAGRTIKWITIVSTGMHTSCIFIKM